MDDFAQFTQEFFRFSGIDLTAYKRPQMERRLTALRDRHGFSNFRQFLQAMTSNERLYAEFLDRMTINVSEFYRNPERWESLMAHLQAKKPLRAWSAACATGEEPYTLAILLAEHGFADYQIRATDIDRNVLLQSQVGRYADHQVKMVPPAVLAKYFRKQTADWVVEPTLRSQIKFELHNLLADGYPEALDLIICRNVLIYFTEEAKQQVIRGFSSTLKPGGLLFVGSTEQLLQADRHQLEVVSPFLYRKKDR